MAEEIKIVKRPNIIDSVALSIYGDNFTGFQKIAEYKDLIPDFKDWYYAEKTKDNKKAMRDILRSFNDEVCTPLGKKFHPPMKTVRNWRVKWNLDLMSKNSEMEFDDASSREIRKVIQARNGNIDDGDLEDGVKTLGAELLNDAIQMLTDDQQLEEIYTNEELMKRRGYIINVFSHTTKLVHGKAALLLKASAEKRDTANFLMSLLSRATSGKISDKEIDVLKSAYAPKQNEYQSV